MLCIHSFELLLFWRVFCFSLAWIEIVVFEKKHHYERRVDCKKHDRKKQRSMDCVEATKKTVQAPLRQAQRAKEKGWGFFVAGDCPAELPVIYFQAEPDISF
jgi:hypothetical protein